MLVEDTEDVASAIVDRFTSRGDAVDHCAGRSDAEDLLAVQDYDLIILDINLADGDGIELLGQQRRAGLATPVIMLTARIEVDDRVAALDFGADDYVTKPFDLRELEARARALIRRAQSSPSESATIVFGDLMVDLAGKTVLRGGETVSLTRREFSLLEILLVNRGRVVAKEQIFERMFSFNEVEVGLNAVETYIGRLRRKIEGGCVSVKTLRGLGYQLVSDA